MTRAGRARGCVETDVALFDALEDVVNPLIRPSLDVLPCLLDVCSDDVSSLTIGMVPILLFIVSGTLNNACIWSLVDVSFERYKRRENLT